MFPLKTTHTKQHLIAINIIESAMAYPNNVRNVYNFVPVQSQLDVVECEIVVTRNLYDSTVELISVSGCNNVVNIY